MTNLIFYSSVLGLLFLLLVISLTVILLFSLI